MILIALGANLPGLYGPPARGLQLALGLLVRGDVRVRRVSSLYGTPPYPPSAQPWFVNAAAVVEWDGTSEDLLHLMHDVEHALGRQRRRRWAARVVDLDLIDFKGEIRGQGQAIVHDKIFRPFRLPHPDAHKRDFVLAPIAEIAPTWRHPILGARARELCAGPHPRRIGTLAPATNLPEPLVQRFLDIRGQNR